MKLDTVEKIKEIKSTNKFSKSRLTNGKLKVMEKRGFNGYSINDPRFCNYCSNNK